jgi:hypothetical protein
MAGQLTLDQHIGVQIPGGQPTDSQAIALVDLPFEMTGRKQNGFFLSAALMFSGICPLQPRLNMPLRPFL